MSAKEITLSGFVKNLNKDFNLNPDFKIENLSDHNVKLSNIKIRIDEIDLDGVLANISSADGVDEAVQQIADSLLKKIEDESEKVKRVANKVIKAWEESPEKFVFKKESFRDEKIYERNLLGSNEYHTGVFVSYEKLDFYFSGLSFSTGNGGHTYYEKEYFVKGLVELEKWLNDSKKKLKSKATLKRIANYILKTRIEISMNELPKAISLAEDESLLCKIFGKKDKKPPFPFEIDGKVLNGVLYDTCGDHMILDKETISEWNEEFEVDWSALEEWEFEASTDEYHNHDGQVCSYTVTFTSPDGHEYKAYNDHCLVTGWNFHGKVDFK